MENKLRPSVLRDWFEIAKLTGRVYVKCEHTSRTNMGAYYTLFVVWEGELYRAWPAEYDAEHDSWNYSEKLAKELGFRNNSRYQAWYRGGCGYDRAHDVVYSMARHFGFDLKDIGKIRIESI